MTKSEKITSMISEKFFLSQYIYTDVYVKEGRRQKERQKRLGKKIQPYSEPEIWDVGIRYGNKIRLYKKENCVIDDAEECVEHGHHKPPRPHMRRAHWHYYWIGQGRTVRKHVWVEPTLVNGTNANIPITITDVTDKESQGYDGENRIKSVLDTKKVKYKPQYTVKSTRKRFDFCVLIKSSRLMIEFDGEQHFSAVEQWGGAEAYQKQKETDQAKNEWCEKNKIPLLRIRYDQKPFINDMIEDFLRNPNDYLTKHNSFLSNAEC